MGENSIVEGVKGFFSDRFSFLENYTRFTNRDKPLPSWTESDVEAFIASDPVHGPALRTAREAVNFCLVGSAVGAVSTAGFCWKYSKSPHGAILGLGAGAIFGWTFGHEVGKHALQLYKVDTFAAQTKFMEWWEKNSEGRWSDSGSIHFDITALSGSFAFPRTREGKEATGNSWLLILISNITPLAIKLLKGLVEWWDLHNNAVTHHTLLVLISSLTGLTLITREDDNFDNNHSIMSTTCEMSTSNECNTLDSNSNEPLRAIEFV